MICPLGMSTSYENLCGDVAYKTWDMCYSQVHLFLPVLPVLVSTSFPPGSHFPLSKRLFHLSFIPCSTLQNRAWHNFCNRPDTKYFSLCGFLISVVTTQLYCFTVKAILDVIETRRYGCIPRKLYS
jgi:hypothetical protein